MSLNGTLNSALPPEEDYSRKRDVINRHDEETATRKQAFEDKLNRDIEEREECMKLASDHAGAIGLVYDATANNYYRIVSKVEQPELPVLPPLPTPPAIPPPPRVKDVVRKDSGRKGKVLDALSWCLSIPVGAFIGYGLATLTGLPIQRQPGYMFAGVAVGISAILAIKILFDRIWMVVGKEKAMNRPFAGHLIFAFFLTAALVLVEAWLGAQALVIYSHRVVFDVKDALQPGTAFPLAIAVSSATLLLSAAGGYIKGSECLSEHDEDVREYEFQKRAHEKETERIQSEYRDSLRRYEDEKQAKLADHRDQLARMDEEQEEMESYRKSADFQALLKYIGRINSLNLIIGEEEAKMRSDRISRGYEKATISK